MIKRIIAGICAVAFLFCSGFLSSAEEPVDFEGMYLNLQETLRNVPAPSVPVQVAPAEDVLQEPELAIKDWTIMVFINGKNNLQGSVGKDLNEMETVGSTSGMNVVVEAGRISPPPPDSYPFWSPYPGNYPPGGPHPPRYGGRSTASLDSSGTGSPSPEAEGSPASASLSGTGSPSPEAEGSADSDSALSESWVGVRRYLILKDTDTQRVTSPILEELKGADMGDWEHLVSFAQWAKSKFPARRYMLIVWNHGDGWKRRDGLIDLINIRNKAISFDNITGNHISTQDLAKALARIGGVDVYASDACLMQMAEVAYEIRKYAKVIVGSEENEPNDGYAYDLFLGALASRSNPTPETVGQLTVQSYMNYYGGKESGITQSAIRASAMPWLRAMLDEWAVLAMETGDPAFFKQAGSDTLNFHNSAHKDLVNFLDIVTAGTKSAELIRKSMEIRNFICGHMLLANASWGEGYEKAHGLAVYLPDYTFDEKYKQLAWARDGKWDEFVQWLLKKSESTATATDTAENTASAD